MTKASLKKFLGTIAFSIFCIENFITLMKNINDAEIVKLCLYSLLLAFSALFALKLGTGFVEAFKMRSGGNGG